MNKSTVDWDAVEKEYLDGATLREMAETHGVSHVAISKMIKKNGWKKGAKTKVKVNKVKVNKVKVNKVTVNHLQLVKQEVGHPTIKTPELLDAIFDAIANGKSTRAVCVELGFSRESFYKWARTDKEFMYQYACAKRFCADFFVEDIIEIADDSSCDTYVDEKGRIIVDHEVIARSKIRIEVRQWAAMRLNSRKYNLPMIETVNLLGCLTSSSAFVRPVR